MGGRYTITRMRAIDAIGAASDVYAVAAHVKRRLDVMRGGYVLMDSDLYVYILPDSGVSYRMVNELHAMVIGLYRSPTLEQLMDDMNHVLTTRANRVQSESHEPKIPPVV